MADDNQDPRFADLPNYQGGVPDNSQSFAGTEANGAPTGQPMSGAGLNLPEPTPDTGGNENVNLNPSGEGLPMEAPGQMAPGEKSSREDNAAGQGGPFAAPGLEATPDVPNIKDYFARTNAMSPQEWDAWKKKLDPQGNKPMGQVGLEIVAAQTPINKVPALQANLKMADLGLAAAGAAVYNGNLYKGAEFLNHAVPLIPALHDVSFSPTRDGLEINQGGQKYVLNSSQAHTLLRDPGFHPDMLQRGGGDGLAALISKVSQDRSPVGPQGPGSENTAQPNVATPVQDQDRPYTGTNPQTDYGPDAGYGYPANPQSGSQAGSTEKPIEGVTVRQDRARGLKKDENNRYFLDGRQLTPEEVAKFVRPTPGENQAPTSPDRQPMGQPLPAGGAQQNPAQQGAQQFQSQLPQGQAANPRGRGTFIPDQKNPGHGAWTGGERGIQGPTETAERPGTVHDNDMVNYMGKDMTHAQAREQSEKFAAEHPQQPGWAASGTPVPAPQRNDRGKIVQQRGGGSGGRTPAAQHTAEIQNQITDRTELANVYKEASHARAAGNELTPVQKEVLDYYENNVMAKHRPQPQYTAQDTGIPPEAVEMLRKNPRTAAQFDKIFGPGASRRVLGQ